MRLPNLHAPIGDSKLLVLMLLPPLGVAVLAQAAVTAMVLDKFVIASLVAGGCCAGLVWMSGSKALRVEGVAREPRGRVLLVRGMALLGGHRSAALSAETRYGGGISIAAGGCGGAAECGEEAGE